MNHIDWKLQHCLHKPIGWIEEKDTVEVRDKSKTENKIKGKGREKKQFGKRTGE